VTAASLTNVHTAALLVAAIAALGSLISTLEWLANHRQLRRGGLFSWPVVRTRQALVGRRLRTRVLDGLLEYRPFCGVLTVRALVLAALPPLLAFAPRPAIVVDLGLVVATTLLLNLRSPYGMDGSDQMSVQIFVPLLLAYAAGSTLALQIAVAYIGVQAAFSYLASGAAKAVSPIWRSGNTVFRIFNTRTYGYEPAARLLLGRPRLTRVVDWSAFTIEMLFPIGLVAGLPVLILFLLWGVTFHAMNALVMGLNSFFWAFVATYPAVIYLAMLGPGWLS
jgi:hypothetical protein